MFTQHFSMKTTPFQEHPLLDNILSDDRFERARARLDHFRENGRVALLCGRTGIGKTTLVRSFLAAADARNYFPLLVKTSRLGACALLRLMVVSMGERPARGRERLFAQLIEKATSLSKTVLLVIDDAHLSDHASFHDLRLLSYATGSDNRPLFRVLLSGQDELQRLLSQDRFADLCERTSVHVLLHPLSETETLSYIQRQLKKSGAAANLISSEIGRMIHHYAGGIPRRINNAATVCLIAAATEKHKIVDEICANHALEELV
ncbi:MAG: AAA family ATPase [Planctomycetes bacterium]|nr:AAA family ATPase [Planctomycetota bacterium]